MVHASRIVGFEKGFSTPNRSPYALARLDCGHFGRVDLKPSRGRCDCGQEIDLKTGHGAVYCVTCHRSAWLIVWMPDRHSEADFLTQVGDEVDCAECAACARDEAWLRALDHSAVHHARLRHGSYCFYRLDHSSPSSFMLIGSVRVTPTIESLLRERRFSPLSPTEAA